MLFKDPLYANYANCFELGRQIAAKPAGEGSYIFVAAGSKKSDQEHAWQYGQAPRRSGGFVLAYKPYE